ncbi:MULTISPECIES: uroporphyrinogen-III synthase [Ramlibacter]|uniref:Uroporphyrinogen-III synthase n=1 Tax=Ramlibacter aquaticus TaxID=2780094 RepID=A0ABR9SBR8_9BURK|nr:MULTISPECIES: uroporphyrinogen-III synthase [Ramlibacter]MBE7939790.1 uroporphyrinogen-III synthase [Ramlibacter aquaticus]
MRVWVTRPAAEAACWVQGLQALGFDAQALPLIEIQPVADGAPLAQAWAGLAGLRAVMFVSGNAVRGFMDAAPQPPRWPSGLRAWATGEGTRQALLQAGVPAVQVDAPPSDSPQFDSEALWMQVQAQVGAGDRVLRVRGAEAGASEGSGRDWLAQVLEAAGATVDTVVAYVRGCPALPSGRREQLRDGMERDAWVFSSSQAIAHLRTLLGEGSFAHGRCVCTHPRIAQAARDAGFGVVRESRPGLPAVAAILESIR